MARIVRTARARRHAVSPQSPPQGEPMTRFLTPLVLVAVAACASANVPDTSSATAAAASSSASRDSAGMASGSTTASGSMGTMGSMGSMGSMAGSWRATLAGTPNYTAISGTGSATVNGSTTTATAMVMGAPAGGMHPWHVHEGVCGSNGPIVGDPAAYNPLAVGGDGHAMQTATINVALDPAKSYYVNVHLSPAAMGTIVACGPLTR